MKWIATKIRRGITPELPKRMPRLVREVVNSCFKHDPSERPTFKQVYFSAYNLLVQLIKAIKSCKKISRLKSIKLQMRSTRFNVTNGLMKYEAASHQCEVANLCDHS